MGVRDYGRVSGRYQHYSSYKDPRGPPQAPDIVPLVVSEPDSSSDPQVCTVQLPRLPPPGRIKDGPRKRRRMASKRYTSSQYEL
jgi:hypothetical protein